MHDNLDVEFTIAQKSVCMWKYTPALQNGFYYYAEYAPKLDSVLKYSCCNVLSNILSDCIVIWNPGIYFMYALQHFEVSEVCSLCWNRILGTSNRSTRYTLYAHAWYALKIWWFHSQLVLICWNIFLYLWSRCLKKLDE